MQKKTLAQATLGFFHPKPLTVALGCCFAGVAGHVQAQSANVPPAGYALCATEGQRCSFSGAAQVVYGARTIWTSPLSFTGGVACNNTTFGDPLREVAKACYFRAAAAPAPAPLTWTRIAAEGGSFTVGANATVRYGAGSSHVQRVMSGAGQCTNAFFGRDPGCKC